MSFKVALVTMPFASIRRPSIQLGLLKAVAERHGFPTDTYHLNLDFARQVDTAFYEWLCLHRGVQVADWIFAKAAFEGDLPIAHSQFLSDFDAVLSLHL